MLNQTFMLSLLTVALLSQTSASAAPADGPMDFTAEAKLLFRIVACAGDEPIPEGLDVKVVEAHCKELNRRMAKYRSTWVQVALPFLTELKPAGLPTTVVYPFGGGDLISALTTYPEAREINTLSLEHAGDPRRIHRLSTQQLRDSLGLIRFATSGLLVANDSKTENLMKVQRGELPGQLSFFLIGLAAHGLEPVSLRYFKLNPDGTPRYLTRSELDSTEASKAKLLHKAWVSPDFSEAFGNMELVFVKQGEDPATSARVHRHFAANLDDDHFGKDAAMKQYLENRGRIVAMTKAASYLLWRDAFSTIRGFLLNHMDFMISDSTGIPPRLATAAGFQQQAYGRYDESFLNASPKYNEDFRKLWTKAKKLPFRYGYVDKKLQSHMLVTFKTTAKPVDTEGATEAVHETETRAAPDRPPATGEAGAASTAAPEKALKKRAVKVETAKPSSPPP